MEPNTRSDRGIGDGAEPESTTSLAAVMFDRLRQDILSGDLKPGQLLSERELVERLGSSRTPIRYALARLQEQGLLCSQARRGYLVSLVTLHDVAEVLQLRTLLEGEAAALAAGRISRVECKKLEQLASVTYVPGEQESYREFVRANREFHETIARASGNSRLARLISNLLDDMQRVISATVALSYRIGEMQDSHKSIARAISRRNSMAARRAVARAMQSSQRHIVEALGLGSAS